MSMWPTITVNPISEALRAIAFFHKTHGRRPGGLLCGPEAYSVLMSVLPKVTLPDLDGGWTIAGAKIKEDESVYGYQAVREIPT